ncbi:hypothetical protein NX059_006845 [Plenodomus lindquistii]|nr:hypothetical protein NX059_006845 [Plenodomus lindquistii]
MAHSNSQSTSHRNVSHISMESFSRSTLPPSSPERNNTSIFGPGIVAPRTVDAVSSSSKATSVLDANTIPLRPFPVQSIFGSPPAPTRSIFGSPPPSNPSQTIFHSPPPPPTPPNPSILSTADDADNDIPLTQQEPLSAFPHHNSAFSQRASLHTTTYSSLSCEQPRERERKISHPRFRPAPNTRVASQYDDPRPGLLTARHATPWDEVDIEIEREMARLWGETSASASASARAPRVRGGELGTPTPTRISGSRKGKGKGKATNNNKNEIQNNNKKDKGKEKGKTENRKERTYPPIYLKGFMCVPGDKEYGHAYAVTGEREVYWFREEGGRDGDGLLGFDGLPVLDEEEVGGEFGGWDDSSKGWMEWWEEENRRNRRM